MFIFNVKNLPARKVAMDFAQISLFQFLVTEAAELGRIKAADLSGTGADLAVSANIGCSLQIREHLASTPRPIPVAHPMELLARAAATPGTAEGMAPA